MDLQPNFWKREDKHKTKVMYQGGGLAGLQVPVPVVEFAGLHTYQWTEIEVLEGGGIIIKPIKE